MEPKTGKRIVSKGEYVQTQGKQTGLRVWGICLFGLTVIFALQAASCMMNLLYHLFYGTNRILAVSVYTVFFLLTGTGSCFCRRWGQNAMERAATLDT